MTPKTKKIPSPLTILQSLTTVHGVNHIAESRGRRLAAWCLVLGANAVFTWYLIVVIKNRYESSQIYTRMDATCRVNQVPFPAVSICNSNMISAKQTKNIESILRFYQRNDEEIQSFFDSLQELAHFGFGSEVVANFTDIMDILKRHYFTVDSIMEEDVNVGRRRTNVSHINGGAHRLSQEAYCLPTNPHWTSVLHQTCDNLLLYCEFNRKPKRCRDVFKMIKTLEGHCCAFNYAALNDATEDPVWEDDTDLEYYDDRKIGAIISTSKSGRGSGLTALVNIEPEDYPPWSNAVIYGAKIIISDPNDFPETTVVFRHVTSGEAIDLKVEPMVFLCEDAVRRVPVPVRDCWFHDEVLLGHTDRYSYETCNTECLMQAYNEQCQCIPYRYPREKSRICELADVPCLHNMTVQGKVPCLCYLECSDKKYIVRSNIMPFSSQDFAENLTKTLKHDEAISIKVYFGESTCNCYKKTLVMDFDRLIGTYGGVVSLSTGGSILTIFEVIYLAASYLLAVVWRFFEHNN